MKWLRFLDRGHGDQATPESADNEAGVSAASRQAPDPGPIESNETGDSGLGVQPESPTGENPYESSSWESDPVKGLRRVEDAKTVRRNRGAGDQSDPYNTGGFRKGW